VVQADLFYHTGRFSDAEPLIRQALAIAEVRRTARTIPCCDLLGAAPTEALCPSSLTAPSPAHTPRHQVDPECGPEHEETAKLVNNLASVLLKQKKLQEAHPVQERAVAIATAIFGRAHPNTCAPSIHTYDAVLTHRQPLVSPSLHGSVRLRRSLEPRSRSS